MKRIIISICLLVFVLSGCIFELIFLNNFISELENDLDTIKHSIYNNDMDAAIYKNEEIISEWKSKHNVLSTFINHAPLIEIETSFEVMKVNLENNEIEDFEAENKKALVLMDHLKTHDLPVLGNVL